VPVVVVGGARRARIEVRTGRVSREEGGMVVRVVGAVVEVGAVVWEGGEAIARFADGLSLLVVEEIV
jgi:hypothetical protein